MAIFGQKPSLRFRDSVPKDGKCRTRPAPKGVDAIHMLELGKLLKYIFIASEFNIKVLSGIGKGSDNGWQKGSPLLRQIFCPT
jgi:hypothetical protein